LLTLENGIVETRVIRPLYNKSKFPALAGIPGGRKKVKFMLRIAAALLSIASAGSLLLAQNPQDTQTPPAANAPDKSQAYYNFAMGRLYAEMAGDTGSKDDLAKAIQYYQTALKLDPSAGMVLEELTDLYISTNRLRDAISLAEDMLAKDPDNLDARRMLGRIYLRALSEGQPGRGANQDNLRKAMEQFTKVTEKDPDDADSWVKLGHLYRMSNQTAEAEKAYNAALKAQPDNDDALTGLAMLYADAGDTKGAIEKLKAATNKNPNEQTLTMLADQYEAVRDYKAAADVLRKALEMAPDNEKIAAGLAADLAASEQYDEALKLYQQMAADEPRDPSFQMSIAEVYMAKHDLAKAREAMDKAKALDPHSREVRFGDAKLLQDEGKNDQALPILKSLLDETQRRQYSEDDARRRSVMLEEYATLARRMNQYQVALDAFREEGDLHVVTPTHVAEQVIDTYIVAKDFANAQKEADLALKSFPDDHAIQMEHASVLAAQGKVDAAVAEINKIPADGHEREAQLVTLAQFYEQAKRYPEMGKALDDAEKTATSDDEKSNVLFMRGAMYERMKKYDESEAEFRKVLTINPNHAEALNYLGYMLADRNVKLEEAGEMIKKALDLAPNNGAFLDSLGWVYYRQGKLHEAEGLLQQALDRGQDPTIHEHLGDVFFKEGKTNEAVSQWQASLKGFQNAAPADADPEEAAKVSKKLDDARVKLAQEKKK
jgi:tetratricopeptide (TPR) repeat protein